jgi:hypothetical protein
MFQFFKFSLSALPSLPPSHHQNTVCLFLFCSPPHFLLHQHNKMLLLTNLPQCPISQFEIPTTSSSLPLHSLFLSPLLDWPSRLGQQRQKKDRKKEKSYSSHIVNSLNILSDSHSPRTITLKSIKNQNNIWLMIGATFLSWSLGLPPKTKLLSLPKHSTNSSLL